MRRVSGAARGDRSRWIAAHLSQRGNAVRRRAPVSGPTDTFRGEFLPPPADAKAGSHQWNEHAPLGPPGLTRGALLIRRLYDGADPDRARVGRDEYGRLHAQ